MKISCDEELALCFAYNIMYEEYLSIQRGRKESIEIKKIRIKHYKKKLIDLQNIFAKFKIKGVFQKL